jgi:glutathione peroxidase
MFFIGYTVRKKANYNSNFYSKLVKTFIMISIFSILLVAMQTILTPSVHEYSIEGIDGKTINLGDYKGKYLLIVNVASECGYTPQYKALQSLYEQYQTKLVVLGVPCNQFGGQEPANNGEIRKFCSSKYGVTFPLTTKVKVKGDGQHDLYQFLTSKEKNGVRDSSVKWNFQKYLLSPSGELIDVFSSGTNPLDESITKHFAN